MPLEKDEEKPAWAPLSENQRKDVECSFDGVSALNLPKPKTKAEEAKLVESFLNGLKKLFSQDDNWLF